MMDLVEFLRARIGDDERIARETIHPGRTGEWEFDEYEEDGQRRWHLLLDRIAPGLYDTSGMGPSTMRHIARHDPARVLRDVEAKRLLLRGHEPEIHRCDGGDFAQGHADCRIKTALALAYADHPEFREEWKIANMTV